MNEETQTGPAWLSYEQLDALHTERVQELDILRDLLKQRDAEIVGLQVTLAQLQRQCDAMKRGVANCPAPL